METRRFPPLLAAVALVILIHQAGDLATLLASIDFATPAGRVRQLLSIAGRFPGFLIADVLLLWALLTGAWLGPLRLAAVAHGILGVALLVLLPRFLLDAGLLAVGMSGSETVAFRITVLRTLLLLLAGAFGAFLLTRALLPLLRKPIPDQG